MLLPISSFLISISFALRDLFYKALCQRFVAGL